MRDPVDLFLAMSTQWRWIAGGFAPPQRIGLDYSAIEPLARLTGIAASPALFNDLRTMEREALAVLNKSG